MSSSTIRPQKTRRLQRQHTVDYDNLPSLLEEAKALPVRAQWFKDGNLLAHLGSQHYDMFNRILAPMSKSGIMKGRWTWGSMCSGSEGAHFVMWQVQQVMRLRLHEMFPDIATHSEELNFEQLFACELDKEKVAWIDYVINREGRKNNTRLICIFGDITELGNAEAWCHTHNKKCLVPDVNIAIVSTSCKDLSTLSQSSFAVPVLSLEHSPGGSADTFRRGLVAYIDDHTVDMVFYENSDHMADEGDGHKTSNQDVFIAEMSSRMLETQPFVLNSKCFGTPQSRRRFWAVLVRIGSTRLIDFAHRQIGDMFKVLRILVHACQRQPPQALDILLSVL